MDFGLFGEKPRKWDNEKFAAEMYRRYLLQSQVDSFRLLVASVEWVGAIWDDHDFAWNNSRGAGSQDKHYVNSEKRRIARSLFLQFRHWLSTKPLTDYPEKPLLRELLDTPDTGVEDYMDVHSTRIILTDGRYYRNNRQNDESILGDEQKAWLQTSIDNHQGFKILCSGSTLTDSREAWSKYNDLEWLSQQNLGKTVIISGDIHKIRHTVPPRLNGNHEFTASGAARPAFFRNAKMNYGMITISENDSVDINLYKKGKKKIHQSL